MEPEIETIPCKICGRPTPMLGTRLCNGCYEIDSRLSSLAKNPQARAYLRAKLGPEPVLDDWTNYPDDWDYEAILTEHKVTVEWDQMFPPGYGMVWKYGFLGIGDVPEEHARKAAALFVALWLRGVSASFADAIIQGYLMYLEVQMLSPLPPYCCRGRDADQIMQLVPATVGQLAQQINRSVRYVHSLCLEDGRFIVHQDGRVADRKVVPYSAQTP